MGETAAIMDLTTSKLTELSLNYIIITNCAQVLAKKEMNSPTFVTPGQSHNGNVATTRLRPQARQAHEARTNTHYTIYIYPIPSSINTGLAKAWPREFQWNPAEVMLQPYSRKVIARPRDEGIYEIVLPRGECEMCIKVDLGVINKIQKNYKNNVGCMACTMH